MKIVFVFPFCSPKINSISGGPIYLGSIGHDVLVITSRKANSLKGNVEAPEKEIIGQTEFYRPYPHSTDIIKQSSRVWPHVREKVQSFEPDIIIGFGEFNCRLILRLRKEFKINLIMFMECLSLDKIWIPLKGRTLLKKIAPKAYRLMAFLVFRYIAKRSSAIMFSQYEDIPLSHESRKYCPVIRYVPWCCEIGQMNKTSERDRKTGIYIGSLEGFKNAEELVEAIPLILNNTMTERFIVVGPGEYAPQVKALKKDFGERLQYIDSVSRNQAMSMLKVSGYGYTPVVDCGLGFIGDCWGTGTPLIATHDLNGFLKPGEDTLVVNGYRNLPDAINKLIAEKETFEHYQQGGQVRFDSNHTGRAVGQMYLEVAEKVLGV